jgi:putative transposase
VRVAQRLLTWWRATSARTRRARKWLVTSLTREGFAYLATVIDCCTKECIGYAIADHMRAELVIDALRMAARNYCLQSGAIFHTDRGSQYLSQAFAEVVDRLDLRHSVGRVGSCFEVSQRRESHPPLLSEPGVTVSRHRAPTVEPVGIAPCFQ